MARVLRRLPRYQHGQQRAGGYRGAARQMAGHCYHGGDFVPAAFADRPPPAHLAFRLPIPRGDRGTGGPFLGKSVVRPAARRVVRAEKPYQAWWARRGSNTRLKVT